MKDYVSEFKRKIKEIGKDVENLYIMNAGAMNHGKSSLFNSLLDSEVFVAQDIRITVKNSEAKWYDNVYLVDTPGLEAEESDDKVAYEAYRKANMIVFVHTAKVGELHKKELAAINKIKSFFADESFFWQHFCLVFTFMDSDSEESISAILNKSLGDIKNFCRGYGFKTFIVSNSRYKKGRAENKQGLILRSGIPEFREYLQKNFSRWLGENNVVRREKIRRAKFEILSQLKNEAEQIKKNSNRRIEQIKQKQQNFLYEVEFAVNEYLSDEQKIVYQESRLMDMQEELDSLLEQWNRERY